MYENAIGTQITEDGTPQAWAIQTDGETKLVLPPYLTEKEVMNVIHKLREAETVGYHRCIIRHKDTIEDLQIRISDLLERNESLSNELVKSIEQE